MSKLKNVTWASLPRQSKLAAILYPAQVPPEIQREMRDISRSEGRQPPRNLPLPDPTPVAMARAGRADYSKVPNLVRRPVR
jgi:hypothetical protein